MQHVPESAIAQFVAAARRVAAYGLVRCSSGNLSWRIDDQRLLVTASRSWMADLAADQVALCRLADAAPLNDLRPSNETRFHAGILRQRPEMRVVLHFQSPCATAIACSDLEGIDFNVIIEVPYYIGPVAVVPYLPAGSPQLAEAVVQAMASHDMALLRNHGQVTVGKDLHDAIQKAAFFELACDVILRAGERVRPLPPEVVAAIRATAGV
jgi:ribulose-5-phosphate 4-epimerase/fuculose-1-phosphate aldolase